MSACVSECVCADRGVWVVSFPDHIYGKVDLMNCLLHFRSSVPNAGEF